jgi:lipopolysaccharide heptosyltransferase I
MPETLSNRQFHRILFIKPSAIGDVVHTLPILNLLRKKFPSARISWLVTPACAGILERHPQLDDVILFERRRWANWWYHPSRWLELRRFTRNLREHEFDLVIDLQGLFRSGWLARKTRAPVRVGFANARELAWAFYTHRVPIDTMEQHAIDRYLKVARFLGCDGPVEYVFANDEADWQKVEGLIRADKNVCPTGNARYALLAPGTNWPTKRWPIERFGALPPLLRQCFNLNTIVIGGPAETELANQIPRALNLAGKTNLRQLCALIERAAVVISNDSAPMHIAAAMNRPLVSLFGPTNPTRTGPHDRPDAVLRLDLPCSPCYSRKCSHQSCLQWLTIDPVLRAVESQLSSRSPAGRVRALDGGC